MGAAAVAATAEATCLALIAKTVFWSFFGIRRRAEHEADVARLTPAQVIVAGLIGAALFIATLVLIVRFVIGQAAG
jgi:hypothetical protein